jgi:hypothetical protein
MTDDPLTRPLGDRLSEALLDRADLLDDRNETSPGWAGEKGRGRKAERLRNFASHLSSDEAAPVLKDIAFLEPMYGPLDIAWGVEIAEAPVSARGVTDALSFLLAPESAQTWVKFLLARYEAGAIADGLDDQ